MLRRSFGFISSTSISFAASAATAKSVSSSSSITYHDLIKGASSISSSMTINPQLASLLNENAQTTSSSKNRHEDVSGSSSSSTTTTSLFSPDQHNSNKQIKNQQQQASSSAAASSSSDASQFAISIFDEAISLTGSSELKQIFAASSSSSSSLRDSVCLLLRAFCSTGQVSRARNLFHQYLKESAPTERSSAIFDTWLQLLVQQGTINRTEITSVLETMEVESKLQATSLTYQSLIEAHIRLQLDPSPLYFEMKYKGIPRTPSVLSLFVKGVAPFRSKEAEETSPQFHLLVLREYLKTARPSDFNIDFLKQRFLVFVESSDYSPEAALWLLFEIEQRCVVDCVSLRENVERVPLVQLLLKCARCGDAETVSSVVAVMERHLIPKSVDVLALTLWAQAVAGRVTDAFDTLEDMVRRGFLDHVDHTRRFVIEALGHPMECHYLTTLADSLNTVEAVDRGYFYLESRHKRGLPVSVHSLDTIVLACGKIGDENRAVETLEAYPSLGVQPRIQSYNALLLSCTGKNKARRHRTVFEAIRRRGIQPNYHTMRILIRQAVLCNHIEEALSYLDQAKNSPGIRIDVEMVLSIFERACKVGDVDTALHVSKVSMECDIGIDPAILRMGCDRLTELGVDASALQETIGVHEKLRGRHGLGRRN